MNRCLLGLAVPLSLLGVACTAPAPVPLTDTQKRAIADTLEGITRAAYAALDARDTSRVYASYSDYTTGAVDGQLLPPWPEYRPLGMAFLGSLRQARDSIQELDIDVLTRDVAVVRGRYSYAYTDTASHVSSGTAAWSWVFAREPQGWRIVHTHLSFPPAASVQHPVRSGSAK